MFFKGEENQIRRLIFKPIAEFVFFKETLDYVLIRPLGSNEYRNN